jgi:hypothetical protein
LATGQVVGRDKVGRSRPTTCAGVVLGVVFTGFTLRVFCGLIADIGPAKTTLAFYLSPP